MFTPWQVSALLQMNEQLAALSIEPCARFHAVFGFAAQLQTPAGRIVLT